MSADSELKAPKAPIEVAHLTCHKLRLGVVEYNNDPRGCGASSIMWQVAQGGNPAVYTDWSMLFDGANIIPAADSTFTVTAGGGAGWNQNFDLTTPIMNANNPGKGTWDWFNKGKPCWRIWSLVTDAESAAKWGTMSVTITRNGVVRFSTAEPLVTVSDDVYFYTETCGPCGLEKDAVCFDAQGNVIDDMAQYVADATGFDPAQIATAFPSDADGTTDEKLKACGKPCTHEYPAVIEPEPMLFEGCDNGTTPFTDIWYGVVDGVVSYFVSDADDALVPYELVGELVDCNTGDPVDTSEACTLDDLAGECGGSETCTEIGTVSGTNNGLGVSGAGTASHFIKHAASSQAIVDQINAWVTAGYVVVMEFGTSGVVSVVDTMNFYSPTGQTFTARADHTQPDPCDLFSQAVDGSGVLNEPVTYTAYSVGEEVEAEKVIKAEIACQRNPLEVTIVDPPVPSKVIESNILAGCDDVNADGSLLVLFYRTQTLCYIDGVLDSQDLSAPYDESLDPYTPVNEVPCDPLAIGADPEPFCDNGNNFIRYSLSLNGAAVIVIDVEVDGTTPYTVVGPVTPGVCPLFEQTADVEQCGTKGTALVGTGRGGIYRPEHSDFFLGTIGPAASFNELQALAAEAGYALWIGPYVLDDGTIIADGGQLCVTGAPEIGTLTYTNGLFPGTTTINLTWQERYAQLVKGCKDDEILAKLCQIKDALVCNCTEIDQGKPILLNADGSSSGTTISFPFEAQLASGLSDFVIPFSIKDPTGCLDDVDPATLFRVRMHFDCHDVDTGTFTTTGFNAIVGDVAGTGPAQLVGESSNNTLDNTSPTNNYGTATAGVGVSAGNNDKADRWVDYDIPLSELQAGTTMTTSGFGASAAGDNEFVGDVRFELKTDLTQYGCEDC